MSKNDIIQMFYTTSSSFTAERIFLVMCLALAVAMVIFLTYRFTYRGVSYSSSFNVSNVMILLTAVVIMIMISSNIVISLGMVGALSIVRFRTAIKDPRDTAFIFWSIIEGLCIGSQNFRLALVSTVFIAIIAFLLSGHANLYKRYLIILRGEGLELAAVEAIFQGRRYQVRTMNTTGASTEMIIQLSGIKTIDQKLLEQLNQLPGIQNVNWLLETGESLG